MALQTGKQNTVANALSREKVASFVALSLPVLGIIEAIRATTLADGATDLIGYDDRDGLILFHKCWFLTRQLCTPYFCTNFIVQCWGGHTGITRTFYCLAAGFYWKGMRQDVRYFVLNC
ncbi:Transposon Ty3-I Gag-Pol polyprotein [Gossypium australe]|uniref:Transposon Ty3-I Gag-Pol polyprotein n=1 Tax=Gossypium australe TaxID=47621 RepID=A0A5B6WPZ3_9ROSI|nr:Transposon Ty3-I Gag-Pol polyprotein [Gossypium australe]